ncbi:hypothetical protein ZHAS_00011431 [Anopheles sinensis]|uniref:Uncharacterized protein n=1 Tax=Anopheles sinensis TaxID=74873 RepID=A0A084W0F6_ANOSI|nr:hypothetical protein ZHAS_00011431 [Anopheles sinensis]
MQSHRNDRTLRARIPSRFDSRALNPISNGNASPPPVIRWSVPMVPIGAHRFPMAVNKDFATDGIGSNGSGNRLNDLQGMQIRFQGQRRTVWENPETLEPADCCDLLRGDWTWFKFVPLRKQME